MSLFKRLLGKNEDGEGHKPSPPPGMQLMGAQLQKKFARGVQYNMKIAIKGDRNVGKSCLFQRLQGLKFKEEYIPTDEIQVCSIQWNYKATDDIVKVEIWDVVDKGKKKKKVDGLKMENTEQVAYEDPCLDAEFVNVYKNTHGVILVYDITKSWTWDYAENELDKIPDNIPVIVLGNHRDMGHHRTVTEEKARYHCESINRGIGDRQVRYAESSMRNGFGLKYLHKFFNLPFLQLQRETLLKQVDINTQDIQSTLDELDIHEESEEQNYDLFIDQLCEKRREEQEKLGPKDKKPPPSPSSGDGPSVPNSLPLARSTSQPVIAKTSSSQNLPATTPQTPSAQSVGHTPVSSPMATTPAENQPKQGFFSKLFTSKSTPDVKPQVRAPSNPPAEPQVKCVDEFIPDERLDNDFLDDAAEVKEPERTGDTESEDEESTGNPMVANFQDDLDSDDDFGVGETRHEDSSANRVVYVPSSEDEGETHITVDRASISSDENSSVLKRSQEGVLKSSSESLTRTGIIHHANSCNSSTSSIQKQSSAASLSVPNNVYSINSDSDNEVRQDGQTRHLSSDSSQHNDNSDVDDGDVVVLPDEDIGVSDIGKEDNSVPHEALNNWLDQLEQTPDKDKSSSSNSYKSQRKSNSRKVSSGSDAMSNTANTPEPTDSENSAKKKKKKKKENDEEKSTKKPKKKKEKDKTTRESTVSKSEKKKKKKKVASTEDEDMNEFEKFLADGSTGDYETL